MYNSSKKLLTKIGRKKLNRRLVNGALTSSLTLVLLGASLLRAVPVGATAYSLFGTTTPSVVDGGDTSAVELGVKFQPSSDGTISAVRFYKSSANTGTHIGSLWTTSGTRLASVTFTGETSSGWQQANFASPVSVAKDTTYIVSYHAPNGHYAVQSSAFTSAFTNGPLTAPAHSSGDPNGVFKFGGPNNFPNQGGNNYNYYVDVVFNTDSKIISVKTYGGATGNGSTDDKTAIQNTLDYAASLSSSNNRYTVYFPAGTYLISGQLTYESNIIIDGDDTDIHDGTDLTIIKNTATSGRNGSGQTTMLGPDGVDVANVTIQQTVFDQRGDYYDTGGDSSDDWLLSVNATDNVIVQDSGFKNVRTMAIWSDALTAHPTTDHQALRNHVWQAGGAGLSYFGAFSDFFIQDNVVEHTQDDGIAVQGTTGGYVNGGTIDHNTIQDLDTRTSYGSTPRGIVTWAASYVDVSNNTITNTFASGILIQDGVSRASDHIALADNTITDAGANNTTSGLGTTVPAYGIFVRNSNNITIGTSEVSTSKHGGIYIYNSHDATLTSNEAFDNSFEGFSLETSHDITLSGNSSHDNDTNYYKTSDCYNITGWPV
jgi:parallel beta-helix repeat protein